MIHFQHKVLLQLFNTGDDRAQKRQPIRGSDEGEFLLCKVFLSHDICINLSVSKKGLKIN